jgi:hypothetical protein
MSNISHRALGPPMAMTAPLDGRWNGTPLRKSGWTRRMLRKLRAMDH